MYRYACVCALITPRWPTHTKGFEQSESGLEECFLDYHGRRLVCVCCVNHVKLSPKFFPCRSLSFFFSLFLSFFLSFSLSFPPSFSLSFLLSLSLSISLSLSLSSLLSNSKATVESLLSEAYTIDHDAIIPAASREHANMNVS